MKKQTGGDRVNVFEDVSKSLNQAIDFIKGNPVEGVWTRRVAIAPVPSYKAPEIKKIRQAVHLSQVTFAHVLGVSPKTVEAWEAGINEPAGPAQRILGCIAADQNCLEKWGVLSEK